MDIYKFFTSKNVGKVRDVRIIKDQRSGKSKGVAYVEFYTAESVMLALGLSGMPLLGVPLRVQNSYAEKNWQAMVNRYINKEINKVAKTYKVKITGLTDVLGNVSEQNIKEIFGNFGDIELIEVPWDPMSGRNYGYAMVVYTKKKDAEEAIEAMDGYKIKG